MGCAPSIQVSQTGVICCRDTSAVQDSPSSSSCCNHQATTTTPPALPSPSSSTAAAEVSAAGGNRIAKSLNQRASGPSGCGGGGLISALQPGHNKVSSQGDSLHSRDKTIQEDNQIKFGPMRIPEHQFKTLLVFGREDNLCETWWSACSRRHHDAALAKTAEDANKTIVNQYYDLVIIDARSSKYFSAESICKAMRASDHSQFTVIVAIVKKSFADREEPTVISMLNTGFSRVLTEVSSVGAVLNDLIQLERCDLANQMQLRAAQAVFTALDSCKEVVHITDAQHRIQYVNKACETVLGYSIEEVLGRSVWEIHGVENHKQDHVHRALDHRPSIDHRPSLEHRQPLELRHSLEHRSSDHKPLEHRETRVNLDISEAVKLQMRRGHDWEGIVACRRKSGDMIHLPSKVLPILSKTRKSEYIVYSSDSHYADKFDFPTSDLIYHRGSIKSLRKGSYDIRSLNSDGTHNQNRRQSLVKLHSLTIEAPITRVINIISAAQENSSAYVSQALERVLEILRSTELYSPQLISSQDNSRPPVPTDPVATDLLGALLAQGPKPISSGRRSSNDQAVKISQTPRTSIPSLQNASAAIKEILAEDSSWSFDVIKLENITNKRSLLWTGMSIFNRFNVTTTLGIDEQTLQNWLMLIESKYHCENSYHNSTHAADVLATTAYFLDLDRVKQIMEPLDEAGMLIAAVVHDVDHPGKNSAFLCNTNNELALLYNDLSVLESHHAAICFKQTHFDERVNIFKALDSDTYKIIRKSIIDMVLATDMTKHFEHLSKFVNIITKMSPTREDDTSSLDGCRESPDLMQFATTENLVIIKRMLIKCADVSNPLRPLHLCIDWAHRIADEYFNQTEEEKKRNLPIVMPQFDRTTCSIPKSQIGFIDFFITDMFDYLDAFADIPEPLGHLRRNYQYWKDRLDEENQASAKESQSEVTQSTLGHDEATEANS